MYTEDFCKGLSDTEEEFYKDAEERVSNSTRPYDPDDIISMVQYEMYYYLQGMFNLIDYRD